MWTTTAQAITELRTFLADNDTDKYCYQKKVLGDINGANASFKTFERRRVTDFTTSSYPLQVYAVGPTNISTALTVSLDDVTSGEFQLSAPPNPTLVSSLTATYYYRWFLDLDLDQFLRNSIQWLTLGTDYTKTPDGLIPAALNFAGHEAYSRLAIWWSVRVSETFLLEDAPNEKNLGVGKTYSDMANNFLKAANLKRDDYYKRAGQPLSPLFGNVLGTTREVTPRR